MGRRVVTGSWSERREGSCARTRIKKRIAPSPDVRSVATHLEGGRTDDACTFKKSRVKTEDRWGSKLDRLSNKKSITVQGKPERKTCKKLCSDGRGRGMTTSDSGERFCLKVEKPVLLQSTILTEQPKRKKKKRGKRENRGKDVWMGRRKSDERLIRPEGEGPLFLTTLKRVASKTKYEGKE